MGEIEDPDEIPNPDQPDDKFYFVDEERLKQRLGGGDGPSFSVASLFSSKSVHTQEEVPVNPPKSQSSVPLPIFAKQSLFIVDPTDSRISDIAKFFNADIPQLTEQEMKSTRREIQSMVYRKSKRAERNQAKFSKSGSNKYSRYKNSKPRILEAKSKFKKQKT